MSRSSSGGRTTGPSAQERDVSATTETTAETTTSTAGSADVGENTSTSESADVGASASVKQTVPPVPLAAVRAGVAKYDLTNGSKGLRVVHDAQSMPVAIAAGETRRGVLLSDSVARRVRATSAKTGLSVAPSEK